ETARGMGILLVRQAQGKYDYLTQLGGNEATQRIISRLAAITVNNAGIRFYLPLRLGAMLRLARRRMPQVPFDAVGLANRIPMHLPRKGALKALTFAPGASKVLETVMEPDERGAMYSRYDFDYIRWQVGDCPILVSETCYIGAASNPF